jgi:Tfp pilus assembly protein PilN
MMIQINLLPGAKKPSKGGAAKLGIGAAFAGISDKIKDPWLLGAAGSVIGAVATVGILFSAQQARAGELDTQITKAVADSTRLTSVLEARHKVTADRDSVQRQLRIIRTIDDNRYNWAHILDEISQALPAYTWLTTVEQTTKAPLPPGADTLNGRPPAAAGPADTSKVGRARAAALLKADTVTIHPELGFRIIGQTVDIQALTLFMKQLESSPYIQHVTLKRSEIVVVDTKDVTEFELNADFEVPPPGVIRTSPLVVPVR